MADPPALLSTGRILDLSLVQEFFRSSDQDQADALAWVGQVLQGAETSGFNGLPFVWWMLTGRPDWWGSWP